VTFTEVGYSGGTTPQATYEQVCRGNTGHAEAVLVKYDPGIVSLAQILGVFWQINAASYPAMTGSGQYRSAIFYFTIEQKTIAEETKKKLETSRHRPVFTEISPAGPFWRAEEYHQNYSKKHSVSSTFCGKL
jgi:peptide-methionine (S)-S-oxide reductase